MLIDQGSYQAQHFLLLRTLPALQEGGNVLMLHMSTRRGIGLVMDEQSPS
jgi:hypothetical protein